MGEKVKALRFVKKNIVFCIAAVAAIITCFFVPPDIKYLGYFDFKTLTCLFITLAVVCALRNIWFLPRAYHTSPAVIFQGLFLLFVSYTPFFN